MILTPDQDRAALAVSKWLKVPASESQTFRMDGLAGVGKTSLARHLVEGIDGDVYFAAMMGKAADVLRKAGCPGASTVHSLIYSPSDRSRQRLLELQSKRAKFMAADPIPKVLLKQCDEAIRAEELNLQRPFFKLNLDSPLKRAALLVVDERSDVNEEVGRDIESFGCKVLYLGDPGQLGPVWGCMHRASTPPEATLTQIHRQAEGNPIIRIAHHIRKTGEAPPGTTSHTEVVTTSELGPEGLRERITRAGQVIVGRNATRSAWNRRIRRLLGRTSPLPEPGDRLMCLSNNTEVGILNGQIWVVERSGMPDQDEQCVPLYLRSDDGLQTVSIFAHTRIFLGVDVPFYELRDYEQFDYGYAITGHKSKGSQWGEVLTYDEWRGKDRRQWLYTTWTRAQERAVLVRP